MPTSPEPHLIRDDFVSALREGDTVIDISLDKLMDLNSKAEKYARLRTVGQRRVSELMGQPIVTVAADCTLGEAAHLLVTHRISGLPVVDVQAKLQGVITEADFLRALGVPSHHPTHSLWQTMETLFAHPVAAKEPDGTVAELMVSDVVTVAPTQSLSEVLAVMKQHRIKRVVVCDPDRKVIGMITRSDLVRAFFDRFTPFAAGPA